MDKIYNFALNSSNMQIIWFCFEFDPYATTTMPIIFVIYYIHAENITGRPEGGWTSLHVHPPK